MSFRRTKKRSSKRSSKRSRRGSVKKMRMRPLERTRPNSTKREYCRFWKSLPEAPKAVQDQARNIKDQPHRSGKRKTLAEMAKAYASQQWDHKLFKSMESLQQERSKAREDIVMPKVIMVAKCGGKAPFEQAACLANCTF